MSNEERFEPQDRVPLPPKGCDTFTTACDYCTVGCGCIGNIHKKKGSPKASFA